MKVKTWVPLAVAVVLGLMAAKLTRDSMKGRRAPAAGPSLTAIVTAVADVDPGQALSPGLLTTAQMSTNSIPAGAFRSPDGLADRVALTRMVKGQPVLESMLAPAGSAAGMQALVPAGMRAITVEVTEFSGLTGLLAPGCRVDVISVVRLDGGSQDSMARTIVQNVEVRAVGRQFTAGAASGAPGPDAAAAMPNSVTLLVTPAQAEAVQLAGSNGRPWLVLRNARDHAPYDTRGTSLADLRGDAPKGPGPGTALVAATEPEPVPQPPADVFEETAGVPLLPAAPRTRTVTFIKGTKEETVQVDLGPALPDTVTSAGTEDATK